MRLSIISLICLTFLFASCSEYQKVLRKDDTAKKYAMADSLYKIGKYKKGLKLMEQIVPAYRGKPQAEKLMFIYANTYYKLEDYYAAGFQFERFTQAYPQSDSTEVASYKAAKSFYQLSERYSLDQKETHKGLEKLQEFINKYPNSNQRVEANGLVNELREKLDKKDFLIANQYLRIADYIGDYKPAIEAFDNFIADHPGTSYRKDAFFGRLKAEYKLAINSIPSLVQERLIIAKGYYNDFMKYYKDTDLAADAIKIGQDIDSRIVTTTETEPTI